MSECPEVYKAINAIQEALAKTGIGKNRTNEQQHYNFRGIDDVYAALAPLLALHKLCILPRAISRDVCERTTSKGSVLIYTTVTVEYDFVSSVDGSKHTVAVFGEAMDSGDKSCNKAMSAALKYACLQAFCIPTEGDNDADSTTHSDILPANIPLAKDDFFPAPPAPPRRQRAKPGTYSRKIDSEADKAKASKLVGDLAHFLGGEATDGKSAVVSS